MTHAVHGIDIYNRNFEPSSDPSGEPVFPKPGSNHVFDEFGMLNLKLRMLTQFVHLKYVPDLTPLEDSYHQLYPVVDDFCRCSRTS